MSAQRHAIRRLLLQVLYRMDPTPVPEASLYDSCHIGLNPAPVRADVEGALRELDAEGYLVGDYSRFDGSRTWSLTTQGSHQAKQL